MTHTKITVSLLALLLSATLSLPSAAAAKKDAPPSQKISVSTVGSVSCETSTIEKYADGSLKKCVLTENKTLPGADLTCAAGGPLLLDPKGLPTQCLLAVDRSYPDPMGVVCDDGKTIGLHPNGNPSKCTLAVEKKATLMGITCPVNSVAEFYPDGMLKSCPASVEKKVPFTQTKEVYVTEFVCAIGKPLSVYPDGKVQQCTPVDNVFMRGKGTCLAGEPVQLQPDGKVQECTYTYPLYQNSSCKVESRVSFHPNASFKDCTLPGERTVGKAVCKADAPVSYHPNGNIASCTLAAPLEKAKDNVLPAGTVVNFDDKQGLK